MPRRSRYSPINPLWFNRLLRWTFGLWLQRAYRIVSENPVLPRTLKPPYVVVGNHVSNRDPFIFGLCLPEPVYWVTSDGNMRTRIMRALLRLVGSIPKSKAIPDIETVNWIVEVIRKRRGVVGIFPEGQATWDGRSLPLIPSTAKLLKILKVPVLGAVIKGQYFSLPRWTWARRRGEVRIEWKLLFGPDELKALSVESILERLKVGLFHDECAYQAGRRVPYKSERRAEKVELALYTCPSCEAIGSLESERNRLRCLCCGSTLLLDRYGFFRGLGGEEPRFTSISDWDEWQKSALRARIANARSARPGAPLFSDRDAILLKGRRMAPMRRVGRGLLVLYGDRFELVDAMGLRQSFPLALVEAIGVLKRNLLDFYVGMDLYQIRFKKRSTSSRKWMDAVLAIQGGLAQP